MASFSWKVKKKKKERIDKKKCFPSMRVLNSLRYFCQVQFDIIYRRQEIAAIPLARRDSNQSYFNSTYYQLGAYVFGEKTLSLWINSVLSDIKSIL